MTVYSSSLVERFTLFKEQGQDRDEETEQGYDYGLDPGQEKTETTRTEAQEGRQQWSKMMAIKPRTD
jgi:hypothetical protein